MEPLDLGVAPAHIASFIHQSQIALRSNRMKTAFGVDLSRHWIHSALQREDTIFPVITVLEVRTSRTKNGAKQVRVFLSEVRAPQDDEIVEGGYTDQVPWTADQTQGAWDAVVSALKAAAAEVLKPPPLVKHQRGYVYFYGQRINGVHEAAGWRLSKPIFPDDDIPTLFHEQPVVCERDVPARSGHEVGLTFLSELETLALLLSVFWSTNARTLRHEQRWVLAKEIIDGQIGTELRQLGFTEPINTTPEAPPSDENTGPTRIIDRLNPRDYSVGGDSFIPPSDGMELLQLFYDTADSDPVTSERFLAAAKAYHTASHIWTETMTGAVAYLVVTAETLIEEDLPTCGECGQKVGLAKAMRELIFRELPGLVSEEQQIRRLLNQAYEIRSKHFHTGQFAAGELEPWVPSPILQPASNAMRWTYERLHALVNSLLVAWLIKRATGTAWPRATEPPPPWKEPEMFAMSFNVGGSSS